MSNVRHLLGNLKTRTLLVMVATVAVAKGIMLYFSYRPVPYNDTSCHCRLEVTGLGLYPLSPLLSKLAVQLILEHPCLHLKNVAEDCLNFWRVPVHLKSLEGPFGGMQRGIIFGMRGALVLVNTASIGDTLALPSKRARICKRMDPQLWLMTGAVWTASVFQTRFDPGDTPRFLMPVQSLVVLVILCRGTVDFVPEIKR